MYNYLYEAVQTNFSASQHGFIKGKSVVTNLCDFCSIVTDYISQGFQVDCIYTDMSKAFDVVDIEYSKSSISIWNSGLDIQLVENVSGSEISIREGERRRVLDFQN